MNENSEETVLLARLLTSLPNTIEILPGGDLEWANTSNSTYPYLLEEGNLGIPQKVLYKSYMTAIRLYQHSKRFPDQELKPLVDSTSIILLANPAHQSALNTRKRLVMKGILDPASELKFTASLLSCLECAKESILWHHRRWLLFRIHGNIEANDKLRAPSVELPLPLSPDITREEFIVVSRACELYPRNYYAWAHRYFCMKSLCLSANSAPASTPASPCGSALIDEYRFMVNWIDRHISDYSAMQYTCSLEQSIRSLPLDGTISAIMSPHLHPQSLLSSYPDHESLWMYLRISSSDATAANSPDSLDAAGYTAAANGKSRYLLRHLAWSANKAGLLELSGRLALDIIRGTCPDGETWTMDSCER